MAWKATHVHSVGSFGERLDDESLILLTPPLQPLVRINDRTDVIDDVFLLSVLVVEGDAVGCQGIKGGSYVNFGTTCDTYVKIWEADTDKVLNKVKHLFS